MHNVTFHYLLLLNAKLPINKTQEFDKLLFCRRRRRRCRLNVFFLFLYVLSLPLPLSLRLNVMECRIRNSKLNLNEIRIDDAISLRRKILLNNRYVCAKTEHTQNFFCLVFFFSSRKLQKKFSFMYRRNMVFHLFLSFVLECFRGLQLLNDAEH